MEFFIVVVSMVNIALVSCLPYWKKENDGSKWSFIYKKA